MAFEAKRIEPIDLQPRKAVGVALPFAGKAVFNLTYETKEAIKSNLINFLLTGKGERYMNPTFGSGLRNLLFSNINRDTTDSIEFLVRDGIRDYFPNLITKEMNIETKEDNNLVVFNMSYEIKGTQVEDEVTINFE